MTSTSFDTTKVNLVSNATSQDELGFIHSRPLQSIKIIAADESYVAFSIVHLFLRNCPRACSVYASVHWADTFCSCGEETQLADTSNYFNVRELCPQTPIFTHLTYGPTTESRPLSHVKWYFPLSKWVDNQIEPHLTKPNCPCTQGCGSTGKTVSTNRIYTMSVALLPSEPLSDIIPTLFRSVPTPPRSCRY